MNTCAANPMIRYVTGQDTQRTVTNTIAPYSQKDQAAFQTTFAIATFVFPAFVRTVRKIMEKYVTTMIVMTVPIQPADENHSRMENMFAVSRIQPQGQILTRSITSVRGSQSEQTAPRV